MIIVIDAEGRVVSVQDEDLFQGSTKLNTIHLIAPFANSVTFKAMFEMPDGTYYPKNLDGETFLPSLKITNNLNAWKLPITFPITQDYGIVNMQIRGVVSDTVVCTTTVKLPIQKGVPYSSNFQEISDKEQLEQRIANLQALLENKTDKVYYDFHLYPYANEHTIGIFYILEPETNTYIPKTLPQDYDASRDYYTLFSTGRVGNNEDGVYLDYVDNQTGESVRLELTNTGVTINGKTIVHEDQLHSQFIGYNNAESGLKADNVFNAINELARDIKGLEVGSGAIDTIAVNNVNQPIVDKRVNIKVPTIASDIGALPNTTRYGASLSLTINTSTYVVTAQLKDKNGDNLGNPQTIDLPLESVVVGGRYDSYTREVVLTLKNNSTIRFSVADLVRGLQTEITTSNKLSVNLVDGVSNIGKTGNLSDAIEDSTHRTVTDVEKSTWNNKVDKVNGKQLSTEDYTTEEKNKLQTIGTAYLKSARVVGDALVLTNQANEDVTYTGAGGGGGGTTITKTSELTNDGDGTSPFATESDVENAVSGLAKQSDLTALQNTVTGLGNNTYSKEQTDNAISTAINEALGDIESALAEV